MSGDSDQEIFSQIALGDENNDIGDENAAGEYVMLGSDDVYTGEVNKKTISADRPIGRLMWVIGLSIVGITVAFPFAGQEWPWGWAGFGLLLIIVGRCWKH